MPMLAAPSLWYFDGEVKNAILGLKWAPVSLQPANTRGRGASVLRRGSVHPNLCTRSLEPCVVTIHSSIDRSDQCMDMNPAIAKPPFQQSWLRSMRLARHCGQSELADRRPLQMPVTGCLSAGGCLLRLSLQPSRYLFNDSHDGRPTSNSLIWHSMIGRRYLEGVLPCQEERRIDADDCCHH